MSQENMKLSVDTGSVLIDIEDKGEAIGRFRFNPNDLDIVRRYDNVVKALEIIEVPENSDVNTLLSVSDEIKEQLDYLLNYKVSDEIFKKCNPLTLTADGDFFVEKVIEGIAALIESTTNQRIKKKKAKIKKATSKYHS